MGEMKDYRIPQYLNDIKKYEKWENCVQDKVGYIFSTPMLL